MKRLNLFLAKVFKFFELGFIFGSTITLWTRSAKLQEIAELYKVENTGCYSSKVGAFDDMCYNSFSYMRYIAIFIAYFHLMNNNLLVNIRLVLLVANPPLKLIAWTIPNIAALKFD